MRDVDELRKDFPLLSQVREGRPIAYLDNAATSQKPRQVIDAVHDFYTSKNANVHRGGYALTRESTELFEGTREKVGQFIHAPSKQVIFTKGTTESINLVAKAWGATLRKGDQIVISVAEHHSNMIPWRMLEQRGIRVRYVSLTDEGRLDMESLKGLMGDSTKMVALAHASNVLGTVNEVKAAGEIAHDHDALFLVDGAQAVPHIKVDMEKIGCDLYAFSSHKMLGPMGVGVLYGREEVLEDIPPYQGGGEMIDRVSLEAVSYAGLPYRFEAGTPNVAGVVGLGAAIDYLKKEGRDGIESYERRLAEKALKGLQGIDGLRLLGPDDPSDRTPTFSFVVKGVSPLDIAEMADASGVCLRAGFHCAEPLHAALGVSGSVRASFAFYNTEEEVGRLLEVLEQLKKMRR